jgi:hypothetical protein
MRQDATVPDRGWILAQFLVAGLLLVLSLVGIVGTLAFDAAELVFSFGGAIQAFAVFPGLVLSLVLNALIMRAHRERGLSLTEKWMLAAEFALIAWLLVLHFWSHSGDALGYAILSWPVVIVLAIVIAIVAGVRNAGRPTTSAPSGPPAPTP